MSLAAPTGDNHELLYPIEGGIFRFMCHKDIECFTKCCAALNLILTPYDILRIKHRLGMSSDDLLEQYTDTKMDGRSRFPRVRLRMLNDDEKRCPFVTLEGCEIYEDRPGACRIYPVGRAALKVDHEKEAREKFFLVKEDHCLGFQEEKKWTIQEWMSNEGLEEYNAMNDRWLEIVTSQKSLGPENNIPKKIQMFFMASYNLDRFRSFLFNSPFFDRFLVAPDIIEKIASDDKVLMLFAFDWLKFSLFGEKTIQIKA